jgi:hypothetical protein
MIITIIVLLSLILVTILFPKFMRGLVLIIVLAAVASLFDPSNKDRHIASSLQALDCKVAPPIICDETTPTAPGNALRRDSKGKIDQLDVARVNAWDRYIEEKCNLRVDASVLKKIFIEGWTDSHERYLSDESLNQMDHDEITQQFRDYAKAKAEASEDGILANVWEKTPAATSLRTRMCNQAKYLFGDGGLIAKRLLVAK